MNRRNVISMAALAVLSLAGCGGGAGGGPGGGGPGALLKSDKPYPEVAYIATYEFAFPDLPKSKQIWYSDGAGKMRMDISQQPTGAIVSIVDYPGKKQIVLMESQKIAMETPLDDTTAKQMHVNAVTAKENGYTELGAKNVNGHNCHGWKVPAKKPGSGDSSVWVDDGTGLLVESVVPMPNGEGKLSLVDLKMEKPDASKFVVPAGYTKQTMPAMPNTATPPTP